MSDRYNLDVHYPDGHILEIGVPADKMDDFMASMGKGEMHFQPAKGKGVWLPLDKIRYIIVEKVDDQGNRVTETEKSDVD